jgi:acetyltransferase-like isoleucine patch superfamily enzyme
MSEPPSPKVDRPSVPPEANRPSKVHRVVGTLNMDLVRMRPRLLLFQLLVSLIPRMTFAWVRPVLYRLGGLRIGRQTHIYGKIQVEGEGDIAKMLTIGESCMFTTPLYLNASGGIRIGNRVVIGHHSMIITDSHEMDSPAQRCGRRVPLPVVVEDGVWIAARVTILPGVTLGTGCVVAAGSVVTRDVPPHTLVAGVPARHIKHLPR